MFILYYTIIFNILYNVPSIKTLNKYKCETKSREPLVVKLKPESAPHHKETKDIHNINTVTMSSQTLGDCRISWNEHLKLCD